MVYELMQIKKSSDLIGRILLTLKNLKKRNLTKYDMGIAPRNSSFPDEVMRIIWAPRGHDNVHFDVSH